MIKDLPVFEILVDGAEGVIANAFVKHPANEYSFIAFSEEEKKKLLFLSAEERLVSGVLIAPDQKIYRRDQDTGYEYYVFFSKETIKDIVKNFAKNASFNNVNSEHKSTLMEGAFMVESWIVGQNDKSSDLGFDVPTGAWMATFYVENDSLWNDIKDGTYKGFSVEGLFSLKQVKMNSEVESKEEVKEEVKEAAIEVQEQKDENIFLSILNDEKLTEKEKEEKIAAWLDIKK